MTPDADSVRHYRCPTCGATKEIRDPYRRSGGNFPESVICGWRGCPDRAVAHTDGTVGSPVTGAERGD